MNKAVVIKALRSPVGKIPGELNYINETELLANIFYKITFGLNEVLIDEAVVGSSFPVERDNLCRKALLKAGLSPEISASTVSKTCASSDEALAIAYYKIIAGQAKAILVGGCEKVSNSSYTLHHMKKNIKRTLKGEIPEFKHIQDYIKENDMAYISEMLARKYDITRRMQDNYTSSSIEKAVSAQYNGYFDEEITPIQSAVGEEYHYLDKDELLMQGRTVQDINSAAPIFLKDGMLTQYNAAPMCDCATGMLIMDYEEAVKYGLKPLAVIRDIFTAGVPDDMFGQAMTCCIQTILLRNQLTNTDIDLYEINESFAVQAILTINHLELEREKVNVNGGNLALGYPIGTTGLRMNITLVYEMLRRSAKLGLSVMCAGGNMANAIIFEACQK